MLENIGNVIYVVVGLGFIILVGKAVIDGNLKPGRDNDNMEQFLRENPDYSLLTGLGVTEDIAARHPDHCVAMVKLADDELDDTLLRSGMYDLAVPAGEHRILISGFKNPNYDSESTKKYIMKNLSQGNPRKKNLGVQTSEWKELTFTIQPGKKYAAYYTQSDDKCHIEEVATLY